METTAIPVYTKSFRILSLDGGGAKGFYSLGFLRELEAAANQPICGLFDAIYGTSTGAIIASLLALGKPVKEVIGLYNHHVPGILGAGCAKNRSAALEKASDHLYGGFEWTDFKARIGIVATNWTKERPLVFKDRIEATHGLQSTFIPGFGCSISEAVQASCSATPFFKACHLKLKNDGIVEARDGGFCANNPSLIAVADAVDGLKLDLAQLRLLSLGVGHYPPPKRGWLNWCIQKLPSVQMLQKTLDVSANTTEIQTRFLVPALPHIRVSDRFESPELATDLLECDVTKLNLLLQKGRDSFASRENAISVLFDRYAKN